MHRTRRKVELMRCLAIMALLVGVSASSVTLSAERQKVVAIYNLVSADILNQSVAGIKKGLADEGFGPSRIRITEVNANGQMNMLDGFSREILSSDPDIVVPISTPVTQSIFKLARPNQAIIFSTVTNPSDVGMDKHPANMTGVSDAVNYDANLKLLRTLFPKSKIVGMIYNPGERNSQFGVAQVRQLVGKYGFQLKLVAVSNSTEILDGARSLVDTVDVFYVGSDNTVVSGLEALLAVARQHNKPVIASDEGSVTKGALAAVSVDYAKLGVAAGHLIAAVLRSGRSPGSFKNIFFYGDTMVVNRSTAKQLHMTIPANVLPPGTKFVGE